MFLASTRKTRMLQSAALAAIYLVQVTIISVGVEIQVQEPAFYVKAARMDSTAQIVLGLT